VFVAGKPLVRRPKHSARLDARARVAERLGVGAGFGYFGKRADVDFRPFPSIRRTLPSYVTVDADLSLDVLRPADGGVGVTATARVENLFDRAYETVVGFPGRGRAVFAGVRVGF
jgi:outer membrane receptor protein involved in Fe transport